MKLLSFFLKKYDIGILFSSLLLVFFGMITYYHPGGENVLFYKQLISLIVILVVYFIVSNLDVRFLKNSNLILSSYILIIIIFAILAILGSAFSGARSWFSLGFFAFQPTDFAKLILVVLLAKYFSKKHIQINKLKLLLISGIYMLIPFLFLLKQPDLGSAMIVFFIWFSIIVLFGVSRKYVLGFLLLGTILSAFMYFFVIHDYQKKRIDTFINPESDLLGSGYNIHQAHISMGNGGLLGQGLAEGTQSYYKFLPEYETDFIFSAFGEEWGFVGTVLVLIIILYFNFRILHIAYYARDNFEAMLTIGLLIYFDTHFILHIGINLGLFPVTGITMPFMSYGGSHLLVEFISLGIINSIRRTGLKFNRNDIKDSELIN